MVSARLLRFLRAMPCLAAAGLVRSLAGARPWLLDSAKRGERVLVSDAGRGVRIGEVARRMRPARACRR